MSSKRRLRRRACANKRRYATRDEAFTSRDLAGRRTGAVMNAYRCHFCRGWHIGHAPAFVQQKLGHR